MFRNKDMKIELKKKINFLMCNLTVHANKIEKENIHYYIISLTNPITLDLFLKIVNQILLPIISKLTH